MALAGESAYDINSIRRRQTLEFRRERSPTIELPLRVHIENLKPEILARSF